MLASELEATLGNGIPDITIDDQTIDDDILRLVFIACHPILPAESRASLTLRLLGGLTTEEIARAFLVPEPTIAQRIVRAKRTLADEHIPFEVPRGPELAARLSSVLEVVYLIFNEGYSATAGDDLMRPALCEDALRLGRILAELTPAEPEVHGLVALMEIQASRTRADLLYKLGRQAEARAEFERAAALTRNTSERDLLLTRAASCEQSKRPIPTQPNALNSTDDRSLPGHPDPGSSQGI